MADNTLLTEDFSGSGSLDGETTATGSGTWVEGRGSGWSEGSGVGTPDANDSTEYATIGSGAEADSYCFCTLVQYQAQYGPVIRHQTGADTYYWLRSRSTADGSIQLRKVVAGSESVLASSAEDVWTTTNQVLRVEAIDSGSNVELEGFVDGSSSITATDSSSTIGAGYGGIGAQSTTSREVDTWEWGNFDTPTTTSTTTTSTTTTSTTTTSTTTTSTTTTSTTTSTTTTSTTTTSTTSTSTTSTSTSTTSTSTSTTSTSTSTTSTSTTTTSSTSTSTSTSTTSTTFTFQFPHGFIEGWESTTSTSTSTTAPPSYLYEWGIPRKSGLTYPSASKVTVVRPTPAATDLDPFSLKTFPEFDGNVGIFDGVGANKLDDGENVWDFTELAPQHVASVSSTTSSTSTSTSTTTTTTVITTTTTTVP